MTNERPRTAEEFMALPEGPLFGSEERLIDGRVVRVPIAPALEAVYHGENDLMSVTDGDGQRWLLGRYANGGWYRLRSGRGLTPFRSERDSVTLVDMNENGFTIRE